jgi:ferredoxin
MKIEADLEVCMGVGMCALTAPDVFEQSQYDGRVVLLTVTPGPAQAEAARKAVALCPSGALSIHEDGADAPR